MTTYFLTTYFLLYDLLICRTYSTYIILTTYHLCAV